MIGSGLQRLDPPRTRPDPKAGRVKARILAPTRPDGQPTNFSQTQSQLRVLLGTLLAALFVKHAGSGVTGVQVEVTIHKNKPQIF